MVACGVVGAMRLLGWVISSMRDRAIPPLLELDVRSLARLSHAGDGKLE